RRLPAGGYAEPRPVVSTAGEVGGFRADAGGTMWLMSDRGLFRMEPLPSAGAQQRAPLIRRVTGTEGTIYSGSRPSARAVQLPHAFKRLRVDFGPASYFQGLTYQYRLDPADAKWGPWTSEAFLDYTNLAAGRYTLRMRARSPEGQVSDEARWAFAVLPPWYRTPWATVLWILLAMALVALLVWLRTRSLHAQAERLRARVMEQTVELRQTVEQLREAKESLVDKNALLEVSNVRLEQVNTRLERLSLVDELTGIANRRYFERALVDEWERALRREEPVALLMLDLDQFKLLNDSRGHPAGDDCLRRIGGFLAEAIRGSGDVVARYGGEEFAVLLPGTASVQAAEVAERLRSGIERLAVVSGARNGSVITASVGVTALVPQRGFDAHTLVERADRALYAAKRDGRNCTRVDRPSGVWLAGATA
ncbi:MAG: hypothetical protein JWN02_2633, partial [Acidobacteria bacterium]|nr:hypothetical protein [Acidobacteriota bacterium]